MINLYNPEIIIIGGGMAAAGERLLANSRKIVNDLALKIASEKCIIETAYLGNRAGMIGAAVYARNRLEAVG